jgi:folate-dependent phosphoribosylglycinamide formyltransferase PurN
MKSLDGAHYDPVWNVIWVADALGNAVGYIRVDVPEGKVIAQNEIPYDKGDGGLDTPADIIRRNDKLYILNSNIEFMDHKASEPQTISVIELGKK